MTDSNTNPLRMFETNLPAEAIAQDRQAIAEFLDQYLATGEAPAIPTLITGPISLDGRREPLGQCAQKWSEMRGKYAGCMFWSVEAWNTFEHVAKQNPGKSNETVGGMAASKRLRTHRLQHDHVFPRAAWREHMAPQTGLWIAGSTDELSAEMDSLCVPCIVTDKELLELVKPGDKTNPWKRYRNTSIRLKRNANWPDQHRAWIEAAGLVD